MKTSLSPGWAADYAEAQAEARLQRERVINQVIESRNPHLSSSELYKRPPLPPWHPRFPTRESYTNYLTTREMGRFNGTIKFPTR